MSEMNAIERLEKLAEQNAYKDVVIYIQSIYFDSTDNAFKAVDIILDWLEEKIKK